MLRRCVILPHLPAARHERRVAAGSPLLPKKQSCPVTRSCCRIMLSSCCHGLSDAGHRRDGPMGEAYGLLCAALSESAHSGFGRSSRLRLCIHCLHRLHECAAAVMSSPVLYELAHPVGAPGRKDPRLGQHGCELRRWQGQSGAAHLERRRRMGGGLGRAQRRQAPAGGVRAGCGHGSGFRVRGAAGDGPAARLQRRAARLDTRRCVSCKQSA